MCENYLGTPLRLRSASILHLTNMISPTAASLSGEPPVKTMNLKQMREICTNIENAARKRTRGDFVGELA